MKNCFLILAFCCLGSISALAQSTTKVVKGAVVDKKGNPIPGAIVEATDGAESANVDADGTYSIEVPIWLKSLTARYAGMKSKKKNLNGQDVIFWLRPESKGKWFINLETSLGPISKRVGVVGGYLGKWGGYAKLLPTFGYAGSDSNGIPAFTLGAIKRIKSPIYAYLGLGPAPAGYEYDYGHGYEKEWIIGGMFEAGFIFNIKKKINISVGYSCCTDFYDAEHEFHFGVGYCFK